MSDIGIQLLSIQTGLPKKLNTPDITGTMNHEWTTGFFKEPTPDPVWAGTTNLAGDGQADLRVHGGPDKAINAYPYEHYAFWLIELDFKELPNGAFGENFTVTGILETKACIGDIFAVGDALVQISQPRRPCWKLSRRWGVQDLVARVAHTGKTGWYFRVLREGNVQSGTELVLMERPYPQWTIAIANNIMLHRKENHSARRALAECPALSKSWRETLSQVSTTEIDTSTPIDA